MNTSPKDCNFTWKMYDLVSDNVSNERRQFFNISIDDARPGKRENVFLNFNPVEPEES